MARPRKTPSTVAIAWGATALLALAGCGTPGSSGGATTGSADAAGPSSDAPLCSPVPGNELVVLEDDQNLQTVDNIVPVANAEAAAADPALLDLLDTVSATLTTDKLIALNKAVDIDRKTSDQAAQAFVESEDLAPRDASGSGPVVVGAANFSESATLAAIYANVLRGAGYDVTVQSLDAREVYLPALEDGQITVFPEYVGTLTEFLNRQINGPDADPVASGDLDATVAGLDGLAAQRGLTVGEPSPAQDQNSFAVTKAFADEHGVVSLSDLAKACSGLVLGAGPECTERPFCQPGLEETYGLHFADFVSLDVGGPLTKTALQQGQISLGLVFSSDGQLG